MPRRNARKKRKLASVTEVTVKTLTLNCSVSENEDAKREDSVEVVSSKRLLKKRKLNSSTSKAALGTSNVETSSSSATETTVDPLSSDTSSSSKAAATTTSCMASNYLDVCNWPQIVESLENAYSLGFDKCLLEFLSFLHSVQSDCAHVCDVLAAVGLKCVGPLQHASGRLSDLSTEQLYSHWRFHYDLSEMQTVLVSASGEHWCLWRDAPTQAPLAVVCAPSKHHSAFEFAGLNLFDALYHYLQLLSVSKLTEDSHSVTGKKKASKKQKKAKSKTSKVKLKKGSDSGEETEESEKNGVEENGALKKEKCKQLMAAILRFCDKIDVEVDSDGSAKKRFLSARKKQQCSKAYHGFGIVVPMKTVEAFEEAIGWRPLNHSYAKMDSILKRMHKTKGSGKRPDACELDAEMDYINMANDEADFGMGLELAYCFFLNTQTEDMFRKHSANLFKNAYSLISDRRVFWNYFDAFRKVEADKAPLTAPFDWVQLS